MSKKLAAKASLIQLPPAPSQALALAPAQLGEVAEHRPKTAPGSMAHFMASYRTLVIYGAHVVIRPLVYVTEAEARASMRPSSLMRAVMALSTPMGIW